MDFSLQGKVRLRQARLDREKAVESARNPAFSKYGLTLMALGLKRNQSPPKHVDLIDLQIKRMEQEMRHKKKYFVKHCQALNYDPIMLVEMPLSQEVSKNTLKSAQGETDWDNSSQGMKQLLSESRVSPIQTTTDAFVVKPKRKRNIWEEGKRDNESTKFQNMICPSVRLTSKQQNNLQRGWSFHKPRLTPDQIVYSSYVHLSSAKSTTPVRKMKVVDFLTNYEHCKVKRIGNSAGENSARLSDFDKQTKHNDTKNVRFKGSNSSV